jgi:hypothetical protein
MPAALHTRITPLSNGELERSTAEWVRAPCAHNRSGARGTPLQLSRPLQASVRFRYRALLRRSAMRVCQPGPVAFQRAITSAGSRREMSFLGFRERGRPPFFTLARASISEVSCGSSRYSRAPTTCASTRARSDLKVWREAFFFTVIGFSHAENVAGRAALDVSNNDQASL